MPLCAFAQQGIEFRDLALKEALAAAQAEGKLVFVDCFTEWCGPCKAMDRQVFPDPEAGAFMNPRFVCVQVDMEKGEGPAMGVKYGVSSYPTFLILDAEGTEINRAVGSMNTPQFVERIGRLSSKGNSPEALEAEYLKGNMPNNRLFLYINTLLEDRQQDKAAATARELVARLTPEEKTSTEYWPLLSNRNIFHYGSDISMFIVNNPSLFGSMPNYERYINDIPAGFLDMQRRFDAGERDKAFINDFALLNYNKISRERASELAKLLFDELSDKERLDPAYFKNVFLYMGTPETFDYLLKNRNKFYKTVGKEEVDRVIWNHYKHISMMVIKGYDKITTDADFAHMLDQTGLTAEPEKITNYLNMGRACLNNDTGNLLKYSLLCFESFNESDVLNFMPALLEKLDRGVDDTQRIQLIASLDALKGRMTIDTIKQRVEAFITTLKR